MHPANRSSDKSQQNMVCKLEPSDDSGMPAGSTDVAQPTTSQSTSCGCPQLQTTIKKEDIATQDSDAPFSETSDLLASSIEAGIVVNSNSSDNTASESDLDNLMEFVKDFKQRRIKRGFTQSDVALSFAVADGYMVSQSTICRFEAMQLSLKSMQKLKPYMKKWLQEPSVPSCDTSAVVRRRRKRTTIRDDLKIVLENHFQQDQKPPTSNLSALADTLDLDKEVVRVWFCNRRQKEKKLNKTETQ